MCIIVANFYNGLHCLLFRRVYFWRVNKWNPNNDKNIYRLEKLISTPYETRSSVSCSQIPPLVPVQNRMHLVQNSQHISWIWFLNVFFLPRLDLPYQFFVAWVVPKDAPKYGALYNINVLFLVWGVVSPSLNPWTGGPRLPRLIIKCVLRICRPSVRP